MPRGKKKVVKEEPVQKAAPKAEKVLEPNKVGTDFCKQFGCYTNANGTGYCDRHARNK